MYNILIVDDDIKLANLLQKLFVSNNYRAIAVYSAKNAKLAIKYFSIDLILIDYMMDDENGIDCMNDLYTNSFYIPSIMLTASHNIKDRLLALSVGLVDYLTKPFVTQELLLKVKNMLLMVENTKATPLAPLDIMNKNDNVQIIEDITFYKNSFNISTGKNLINLSSTEAIIFECLFENYNQVVLKEKLLLKLNKEITLGNLSSINVTIMRLRKKIISSKGLIIKAVRSKGYMLTHATY